MLRLVVFASCLLSALGIQFTCSDSWNKTMPTVLLSSGTRGNFWSPNFPQTLSHEPNERFPNCNATFQTDTGSRVWVSMLNAYLSQVTPTSANSSQTWKDVDTNTGVYTFLSDSEWLNYYVNTDVQRNSMNWSAFQAQVIATNNPFDCPNVGAISLKDASDIIAIASSFFGLFDKTKKALPASTCRWSFSTSSDQKFKVVVNTANFQSGESLILQAGNNAPVRLTKNSGSPVAYDLVSNVLTITYTGRARTSDFGFHGHVTAVRRAVVGGVVPACPTNQYDIHKGYVVNDACSSQYTVPLNSQTRIRVTDYHTEAVGDSFTLTAGSVKTPLGAGAVVDLDARSPHFSLDWRSDGSIVQAGFAFQKIEYSCENAVVALTVPCNGSSVTTDLADKGYCNNQSISYTFQLSPECVSPLSNAKLMINAAAILRTPADDLRVYSGSELLLHADRFGTVWFPLNVFAPTTEPIHVEFNSGPAQPVGQLGLGHYWFVSVNYYKPQNN